MIAGITLARACAVMRWIVGGLFIYAGSIKLSDAHAFAAAVDGFRLLPWPLVVLTATTLPVLEILAGLLLVANIFSRPAAWVILALCAVFCAAISSALARGLDISCGCFGALADGSLGMALVRVILLLGFTAFWLRFAGAGKKALDSHRTGAASLPIGTVATRVGLLVMVLALTLANARASVSLSAQFGELYQADGTTRAPLGSVAILVADTAGDGLSEPKGLLLSPGQVFGGDNLVLAVASVAPEESTGGVVRHVDFGVISFSYPGAASGAPLAAGTKLWLMWFPALSSPGTSVPGGSPYGKYRSDTMQSGSESTTAFVTPADGGIYRLAAFTDAVYTSLGKEVPANGKVLPSDFAASLKTSSAFDSWLARYFSAEEISDPKRGGAQGDIDGDGIPNLAEYALGLHPREIDPASSRAHAVVAADRASVTYSYTVAKGVTDVGIKAEMSTGLSAWDQLIDGQGGVTREVAPRDDATDLVTWTVPVPAPGDKIFLRLKVTSQ